MVDNVIYCGYMLWATSEQNGKRRPQQVCVVDNNDMLWMTFRNMESTTYRCHPQHTPTIYKIYILWTTYCGQHNIYCGLYTVGDVLWVTQYIQWVTVHIWWITLLSTCSTTYTTVVHNMYPQHIYVVHNMYSQHIRHIYCGLHIVDNTIYISWTI